METNFNSITAKISPSQIWNSRPWFPPQSPHLGVYLFILRPQLTSVVRTDSLIVTHLEAVENSGYVDVSKPMLVAAENIGNVSTWVHLPGPRRLWFAVCVQV